MAHAAARLPELQHARVRVRWQVPVLTHGAAPEGIPMALCHPRV
jgi:hypothetical protein